MQIKVDLAKELVDKIAAGETAASEAKKLEEAKDAVADAEKAVEDAQAVVDDLKRRLEEALNADPVDQELVDSLREQLKVAEAELVTAKENLEAAEALVRALESDVDPEHEKHLEFDAHKDEWNEEAHEKAMAEYDAAVDNAKAVMDAAQAKVDEIKAKLEAMQAACDDDSLPHRAEGGVRRRHQARARAQGCRGGARAGEARPRRRGARARRVRHQGDGDQGGARGGRGHRRDDPQAAGGEGGGGGAQGCRRRQRPRAPPARTAPGCLPAPPPVPAARCGTSRLSAAPRITRCGTCPSTWSWRRPRRSSTTSWRSSGVCSR